MKRIFCVLLTQMFLFIGIVNAQDLYKEKYLIQIPESWKSKPKLLMKIADLLESNVSELKNKQQTLVGKANYRAAVFLSKPIIENITPIINSDMVSVKFRFCSYFNIYDDKDQLLHRLVLVDSSEIQSVTVNDPNYYSTQFSLNTVKPRNDDILKPLPNIYESSLLKGKQAQFKGLKREALWNIVMRRIMKVKLNTEIKVDQ